MALIKCSECGSQVSTKAERCPNCGAPVEVPPLVQPTKKKGLGCGTTTLIGVGLLFVLPLFIGMCTLSTQPGAVPQNDAADRIAAYNNSKAKFDRTIDAKYTELLTLRKAGDLDGQARLIQQFTKFKRLDYQKVGEFAKEVQAAQSANKIKQDTENALARLAKAAPTDTKELASVYAALKELDPENTEYATNAGKYGEEWKKQEAVLAENAKIEAEKQRLLAAERARTDARNHKIKMQFSAWDGSHRQLEKLIKHTMNDPDSYKHDTTRYTDMGDYILVKTTFRGKNAFGGVVLNWVSAKFTIDGDLIGIVGQGP